MDLMGLARENVTETVGFNDPDQGKVTGGESQLDLQVSTTHHSTRNKRGPDIAHSTKYHIAHHNISHITDTQHHALILELFFVGDDWDGSRCKNCVLVSCCAQ